MHGSFWLCDKSTLSFNPLEKDLDCDIAVVGGGIAGLNSAYILMKAGYKVAVFERNTIGSGTSSKTMGKITSQHGIIYSTLIKKYGYKMAKKYGDANESAIAEMENIVRKEKISCDWQIADNYIYTTDKKQITSFKVEARNAKSLGLPAGFAKNVNLPFPTVGAVRFKNQAKFHVQKYMYGLAKAINKNGGYVFEDSQVSSFNDGKLPKIKVNGKTVNAKKVIIATKVPPAPLFARASYALLEYPNTSYIVAGNYSGPLTDVYISTDKNHYSIMPFKNKKYSLLLIGGQSHIPGTQPESINYKKLTDYAKNIFNLDIKYRWKGMDYLAYDGLPLVGKLYPWSKNIYAIGGFKKWGLTTSIVCANVIKDRIINQENPLIDAFETHRVPSLLNSVKS